MILTLPISHLINAENYLQVPGVHALEFKKQQSILDHSGPLFFHSSRGVVDEDFIDYFDDLLPYLNDNRFKHFSFDLGPASPNVRVEDYYYVADGPVLSSDEILKLAGERIAYVKKHFKGTVAMENLNYFPTSAYDHVCDPDFFSKVIRETDTYMILDIAHAMVSSRNLGMQPEDYFSKCPLDRVVEIHLSAHGVVDDKWRDLHERPNQETYKILEYIQSRLNDEPYLIIEFYKDFSELIDIYREVGEWIEGRKKTSNP
jgi:uncharacterized protein (UPF0276 family)